MLAAAVIGCDRGKPREDAATNDAKASADADLRKALDAATKKAKEMEARALAAEAALAKVRQAQAKAPPESIPNEKRPVGDRVIRGWDGYKFRDVRIKDLEWLLTSDNQIVIQGVPKVPKGTAPPYVINGPDLNQVAEAWVIEFVTGRKVDIPQR